MLPFFYNFLLKLLYPTSMAVLLLLASALLHNRKFGRKFCFWAAVGVLMLCGNRWVGEALTQHLECQYPPLQAETIEQERRSDAQTTLDASLTAHRSESLASEMISRASDEAGAPSFAADCILVLGGGIMSRLPPRPTVEVSEAGDRVLYAAYLFRHGKAPKILCTSGAATGSFASRPPADDMAELLEIIGIPPGVVLTETRSGNTHEHAVNVQSILKQHGFTRVLLVTSAMHMPRSIGTFSRVCPGIQLIPAPTDFRIVERPSVPWYAQLVKVVPTPANLTQFSETMHEYLGIAYYKLRGWM